MDAILTLFSGKSSSNKIKASREHTSHHPDYEQLAQHSDFDFDSLPPDQQQMLISRMNPEDQKQFAKLRHSNAPESIDLREEHTEPKLTKPVTHLPNSLRVEHIISSLRDFQFEQAKPKNIVYTLSEEDQELEKNIKLLFDNKNAVLWTYETLKNVLIKIVDRQDFLIHPKDKEEYERNDFMSLNVKEKRILELFYPNLVRLMMAVIAHIHSLKVRIPGTKDAVKMQIIQDTWQGVLSELNDILGVVTYANTKNAEPFLEHYPTEWSEVIKHRNKHIALLNENINVVSTHINDLEKIVLKRDAEMEAIRIQYANQIEELEKTRCERRNMEEALSSLLDVKVLVKNNIAQLTQRFVQKEREVNKSNNTSSEFCNPFIR
jgi:hypothetical protein